jgi:hypothetical protein
MAVSIIRNMPPAQTGNSKKKNPGGKGMRRAAKGGNKREKKNKTFCQDFVDDIMSGESVEPLTVARVERLCGSGQMQLLTVDSVPVTASLKGNLRCKKGAARSEDNTIAAFAGTSFVILQVEAYLSTIVGVLTRAQVSAIASYYPKAPKGFFEVAKTDDADGFEWDVSDGEGEEDEEGNTITGLTASMGGLGISGQGLPMPGDDDDVDLNRL